MKLKSERLGLFLISSWWVGRDEWKFSWRIHLGRCVSACIDVAHLCATCQAARSPSPYPHILYTMTRSVGCFANTRRWLRACGGVLFVVTVSGFEPDFLVPLENVTIAQGRDATFTCVVNNLGGYRVSGDPATARVCINFYTRWMPLITCIMHLNAQSTMAPMHLCT